MKLATLLLLAVPLISFSQEFATTESGKKVILNKNGTWKYVKEESKPKPKNAVFSFTKELHDNNYSLNGIVEVENGREEKVKVKFTASVPKEAWDNFVQSRNTTDADFFYLIANMLSIDARYTLKNTLSFQPFPSEFFSFMEGQFMSNFKMTGRNGYGNEVETSSLVKYDPNESSNFKDAPLTPPIKN